MPMSEIWIRVKDAKLEKSWGTNPDVRPAGEGWQFATMKEFQELHKAKRTGSIKYYHPETGQKFHQGADGKLYEYTKGQKTVQAGDKEAVAPGDLWDLTRPDRMRGNDTIEDFSTRAPTTVNDVGKYLELTHAKVPPADPKHQTENDHVVAAASLSAKYRKDHDRPRTMAEKKAGDSKYHALADDERVPFKLIKKTGNDGDLLYDANVRRYISGILSDQGWTQAIPQWLHKEFSPTYTARQFNKDAVPGRDGKEYTAPRAFIDAEIPATALHRDKKSLLKGLWLEGQKPKEDSRGKLNPGFWGGARTHVKREYAPESRVISPQAPAFKIAENPETKTKGNPLTKKSAGGGLIYQKVAGLQLAKTDKMLNKYLGRALSNPKGAVVDKPGGGDSDVIMTPAADPGKAGSATPPPATLPLGASGSGSSPLSMAPIVMPLIDPNALALSSAGKSSHKKRKLNSGTDLPTGVPGSFDGPYGSSTLTPAGSKRKAMDSIVS